MDIIIIMNLNIIINFKYNKRYIFFYYSKSLLIIKYSLFLRIYKNIYSFIK